MNIEYWSLHIRKIQSPSMESRFFLLSSPFEIATGTAQCFWLVGQEVRVILEQLKPDRVSSNLTQAHEGQSWASRQRSQENFVFSIKLIEKYQPLSFETQINYGSTLMEMKGIDAGVRLGKQSTKYNEIMIGKTSSKLNCVRVKNLPSNAAWPLSIRHLMHDLSGEKSFCRHCKLDNLSATYSHLSGKII